VRIDIAEMKTALAGVGFVVLWAAWFIGAMRIFSSWLFVSPYDPRWRRTLGAITVYLIAIFGFQLALALVFLRF